MKKYPKSVKFLGHEAFFQMFREFIRLSERGVRTKKNGDRLRPQSIDNYSYTLKLLNEFCVAKKFEFRLYLVNHLNSSELAKARKYWKLFYLSFTNFLYDDKGHFDNYVGFTVKNIRVFLNYLNNEVMLNIGNFHKQFHIPKEDIQIVVLDPEQLNYLIFDQKLSSRLTADLLKVRDVFAFGCTVALRFSDLQNLRNIHLMREGKINYLKVHSQKKGAESLIKLPDFAMEILKRCGQKGKYLLPRFSKGHFNNQLKKLSEFILEDFQMPKIRMRRGQSVEQYKVPTRRISYCMADHVTTHTMRRTAITTMLRLGMPEQQVRRISGHAPNSKEFYKYVAFSQAQLDSETDIFFQKLSKSTAELSKK